MANAKRDENARAIVLGVASDDNVTPTRAKVDPVTNYLLVTLSSDSISIVAATKDKRDENDVPTVYGVSSVDNVTLVPIRTDSTGKLLIHTT